MAMLQIATNADCLSSSINLYTDQIHRHHCNIERQNLASTVSFRRHFKCILTCEGLAYSSIRHDPGCLRKWMPSRYRASLLQWMERAWTRLSSQEETHNERIRRNIRRLDWWKRCRSMGHWSLSKMVENSRSESSKLDKYLWHIYLWYKGRWCIHWCYETRSNWKLPIR